MNRLTVFRRVLFLLLCGAILSASCADRSSLLSPKAEAVRSDSRINPDSLVKTLNSLIYTGDHEKVIGICRPLFREAYRDHDTLAALYTGAFLSQSFLFLEDMDSTQFYTDLIKPMYGYPAPPSIHIMLSNVLGSYSLRTSLDYSKALGYYIDGLEWAELSGNVNNRISLLSNIVNIFYLQGDPKGMMYAKDALKLAGEDSTANSYARCAANIVMAQMYFIQDQDKEALEYLEKAREYAEKDRALSQYAYIYSMLAQVYQERHDYINAGIYYRKAEQYIRYTDPGAASQVYMMYGNYLKEIGDTLLAARTYHKGLELSEKSGNIEYRQALLGQIADIAYEAGDWQTAAKYSRMYKNYSESISSRREAEFNDLIMTNMQAENEKQVLTKEIERQKVEQRYLKLLFIFVIVIISAGVLFLLYHRQRKMYGELVKKHQEYISRLELKNSERNDTDNTDRVLFNKIENLMRNGKIYHSKNLSLEMLADQVGSNRTYCSQAINTFSGMSFNRYVDTFRIEEATRIIAKSDKNLLMKQLADMIGYNSVTVFSKAFKRETGCTPSIYRKEIQGYKSRPESDNM